MTGTRGSQMTLKTTGGWGSINPNLRSSAGGGRRSAVDAET